MIGKFILLHDKSVGLISVVVCAALSVLFIGCATLHAEETEQQHILAQATEYFHQANELYSHDKDSANDLYHKALLRYQKLVDSGIRNGRLFYNIGNVYFRINDLGRAILNYRRAALFIPDDSNLRQNLPYALQMRQDDIKEKQEKKIMRTLFFWHYDLPPQFRFIIFYAGYLLFWVFISWRLLFRNNRDNLKWWAVASACVFLVFGGSLFAEQQGGFNQTQEKRGVITSREVIARKGDGTAYQPSFAKPLHSGTDFILLEDRGDWVQIELTDGSKTWLPADTVELVHDF